MLNLRRDEDHRSRAYQMPFSVQFSNPIPLKDIVYILGNFMGMGFAVTLRLVAGKPKFKTLGAGRFVDT